MSSVESIVMTELWVPSGVRGVAIMPDWTVEVNGLPQLRYGQPEVICFTALATMIDEVIPDKYIPDLVIRTYLDLLLKGAESSVFIGEELAKPAKSKVSSAVSKLLSSRNGLLSSNLFKLGHTSPKFILLRSDIRTEGQDKSLEILAGTPYNSGDRLKAFFISQYDRRVREEGDRVKPKRQIKAIAEVGPQIPKVEKPDIEHSSSEIVSKADKVDEIREIAGIHVGVETTPQLVISLETAEDIDTLKGQEIVIFSNLDGSQFIKKAKTHMNNLVEKYPLQFSWVVSDYMDDNMQAVLYVIMDRQGAPLTTQDIVNILGEETGLPASHLKDLVLVSITKLVNSTKSKTHKSSKPHPGAKHIKLLEGGRIQWIR